MIKRNKSIRLRKLQNSKSKLVSESDIDELISPMCNESLEEILCETKGEFKLTERAASVKEKLRYECKDFKRLCTPYEQLMVQGVRLVEDVVGQKISYETGKKLCNDIENILEKCKSEDECYDFSKELGNRLKDHCIQCLQSYQQFTQKINSMGLQAPIDDMILSHYLEVSVIPILEQYRDVVVSYENLRRDYWISKEFFKSDYDSFSALRAVTHASSHSLKGIHQNKSTVRDNTFFTVAPFVFGLGVAVIGGCAFKKFLNM